MLDRRNFISLLGLLGIGSVYKAEASVLPVATGSAEALKAGPYLQSPCADSMTIRWITQTPGYSWVEYGTDPDKLNLKAQHSEYGLVAAYNTVNVATLAALQPGRQYYYRICSKNIEKFDPYEMIYGPMKAGKVYSFNTVDPDIKKVRFLVFNDIHDRPESFPVLMQYQGADVKDFVFLNGDMFNFQSDEDQLVNHLLQPFSDLFATTPFFFSRGNHEARGKFARHLPQYFNAEDPRFYFSFRYGPLYAIVLDSGEDKADTNNEYFGIADFDRYRLEQAAWLKREIEKEEFKNARYKIVFSHIPLYYAGDWHGPMHCRQVWGSILNQAKIDLLISGHTHKYGIHTAVAGLHNYPIVIGGGPQNGNRTIIKVEADQSAFKLEMLDDSGKTVGTLHI